MYTFSFEHSNEGKRNPAYSIKAGFDGRVRGRRTMFCTITTERFSMTTSWTFYGFPCFCRIGERSSFLSAWVGTIAHRERTPCACSDDEKTVINVDDGDKRTQNRRSMIRCWWTWRGTNSAPHFYLFISWTLRSQSEGVFFFILHSGRRGSEAGVNRNDGRRNQTHLLEVLLIVWSRTWRR